MCFYLMVPWSPITEASGEAPKVVCWQFWATRGQVLTFNHKLRTSENYALNVMVFVCTHAQTVCVCVVYMHLERGCGCLRTCVEPEDDIQVLLYHLLPGDRVSHGTWSQTEIQHALPQLLLSPLPIMLESLSVVFLHGGCGFELMSSHLHSKHRATSPAPDNAFDSTKENVSLSFLFTFMISEQF